MINKPIPFLDEPKIVEAINITHSPFIKVTDNEFLIIAMQYPLLNMKNAINDCYMRIEVYEKLKEASKLLPRGYKFKILDAYRPFALQKELYDLYKVELINKYHLENKSEEEVDDFIKRFISLPNHNSLLPPVHTTGGAIDLTIVDEDENELEMGTEFDEFSDKTLTAFYEKNGDTHIKTNRRMLYNIMISVGFTNLPSEWWHYDYLDRFYAYYNNKEASYEGIFTLEEVLSYNK